MVAKRTFLFRALLGMACLCWMAGCAPTHIAIQVESHAAPNFNASVHKRFSFLPPEGEKPLTQKLLVLIRGELEKKGFVHDDRNPSILVSVKAGTTTEKRREPVVSRSVPVLIPSREGGTPETHYVIEGGGSYTVHIRQIRMDVFDAAGQKPGNELWQGEVSSEGDKDIGEVAGCLVSALLQDYPAGRHKSRMTLRLSECR
jgi:hypothetical protein